MNSSQQVALSSIATEGGVTEIRVTVTHAAQKFSLTFPSQTLTIGELKSELAQRTGVSRDKQCLLFGGPVLKQHRRESNNGVRLIDIVAKSNGNNNNNNNCNRNPTQKLDYINIPVMLIGTDAKIPKVNEEAVAQLHRLVTTTVEHDNRWFRCSYSKGYARQTAFVCRTCVRSGKANAAHAICYACAEVCHVNHDVEEWGVRYYMRCDCCTPACWRDIEENNNNNNKEEEVNRITNNNHNHTNNNNNNIENDNEEEVKVEQEPTRCCFLVDSSTGQPPTSCSVIPLNRKNRYPRSLHTWCYCNSEENHPEDDPECGGIVCMLCCTCHWSAHITRINSDIFKRLPCYGDVEEGEIVAFHCNTCETLICSPCRLRCHREHDINSELIIPSRAQGTDNGAPAGIEFSCGCRGCCSIAEEVTSQELNNKENYKSMSPADAIEVMNSDAFMGFICARCMQEHPWLLENDPRQCYNGKLPEPIPEEKHLKIVKCGVSAEVECASDIFPFHGMLYPVDAFTEEMTCKCKLCREAYEKFAPRAPAAAVNEMMVQLHDACDHCGHIIRDEQAFMCQTCELQNEKTFFVCKRCNSLRLAAQMPALGGNSSVVVNDNNNNNDNTNDIGNIALWDHPLSHIFMEDTYENLYALCGMQLMHGLDSASREYVLDNMDITTNTLEGVLQRTFGQTPLVFDAGEVAQHHQELQQQQEENEKLKKLNGETKTTTITREEGNTGKKRQRNDGESGEGDDNSTKEEEGNEKRNKKE